MTNTATDELIERLLAEILVQIWMLDDLHLMSEVEEGVKSALKNAIGKWQPLLTAALQPPTREIPWKRFDRQQGCYDGDSFLVAVPVCNNATGKPNGWQYELSVITIRCDEDTFAVDSNGEPWGWSWEDIEWIIPVSAILPPRIEDNAAFVERAGGKP